MDFSSVKEFHRSRFSHERSEHPDQSYFRWHCHPFYELLYVVEGKGKYVIESAEYTLSPGTMYLIRPNEFHYVCPDKSVVYERYVVNFESVAVKETVLTLSMMQSVVTHTHGVYFPAESVTDEMRAAFAEMDMACTMFEGAKHRVEKEETMILSLLTQVLLRLSLAQPETSVSRDEHIIGRVIEYLNLHLTEDISLDDISQRFFISKYYLCRAFRKHTGASLFGYVTAKRIAMAQTLLTNGDTATAVAYQVGFRNYSSFYRAYCKQTGHAPVPREKKKV